MKRSQFEIIQQFSRNLAYNQEHLLPSIDIIKKSSFLSTAYVNFIGFDFTMFARYQWKK